ncbi:MAG: HAMP domain-containing histidine kinase [Lachnospiraceae bacterium]|nr:HAMP domain-containing histidine kinase [Lachnospiraceae bacterium]
MRLFSKVFFSITVILCLSLAMAGYLMMSSSLRESVAREMDRTISSYRMLRYILQGSGGAAGTTEQALKEALQDKINDVPHGGMITVTDEDYRVLYNEFPGDHPNLTWEAVNRTSAGHLCLVENPGGDALFVTAGGTFTFGGRTMLLTVSDTLGFVTAQTDSQLANYRVIYLIVCGLALAGVSLVAFRLVRPIGRTARSAELIAKGEYHTRVEAERDDELGDLVRSFNDMAQAVEGSVEALQQAAQAKEDFVGNFAHELKTPLTSVIGYADMLTKKELPPEEVRPLAQYILDEGLHLEALSYKLMELIVLNKQDFVLEALSAKELFDHVAEGLKPFCEERDLRLETDMEETYLRVEYDLFKTMLLNLIDNAAKADAKMVKITGRTGEELRYDIAIRDDGRGMPEEALSRVTEAFYMVDKSRARAQHGAGLGLALVQRIVELHQATLTFESEEGRGTTVLVCLPLRKEDMEA